MASPASSVYIGYFGAGPISWNGTTLLLPSSSSVTEGTGTATAALGGVLTVNTTSAGTGADTNETDLWTYSLPANTLVTTGKTLRITVFGTTAANANAKTVKVYFGSTNFAIMSGGTTSGAGWSGTFLVTRTGASAQNFVRVIGLYGAGVTVDNPSLLTVTETETSAIVIKVTGQNGSASANDIVFKQAIVECL